MTDRNRVTKIVSTLLSSLLLAFSLCAEAELSDVEQNMVVYIDDQQQEAKRLLEEIVNINSGTLNLPGVKKVGEILQPHFDSLGFNTTWLDGQSWNRSGHLVATHMGKHSKSPHILLIGHLDTVFSIDSDFQKFEDLGNNKVRGPGITDMKGGDVIILQALGALKNQGVLDDMNITVFLTGDEEFPGSTEEKALGRAAFIEAARTADIAIGFENGDGNPATANVARRGITFWSLKVEGQAAHSSQIFKPEIGTGAIFEASRIINAFYDQLCCENYLTFNPALMLGGTRLDLESDSTWQAFGKTNVVAQHAIVNGDIRMISLPQLARVKSVMKEIVHNNNSKTSATISFNDAMPPLIDTQGNRKLLGYLDQVSHDLGFGSVTASDPNNAGAADISFIGDLVDMSLDGLGLGGKYGHTVNEVADMETFALQTKRTAVLLHRLAHNNLD